MPHLILLGFPCFLALIWLGSARLFWGEQRGEFGGVNCGGRIAMAMALAMARAMASAIAGFGSGLAGLGEFLGFGVVSDHRRLLQIQLEWSTWRA
jgi:hypothetical protein